MDYKNAVMETGFEGLNLVRKGKVRDVYDLGDSFLMIATDRISAFDVVMPTPIPDKGKILNQISLFWFERLVSLVPNHVISGDIKEFPSELEPWLEILAGRSMIVKKAEPLPVECVVRGYISGSGWKSYQESGTVCGIELPQGLRESDRLPEPIFTPSTKEEAGKHDININFEETCRLVGKKVAEKIRDLSLEIYKQGSAFADSKGIIIADTKFEFGFYGDELILIDEVLTPDSSRFWPKDSYKPGGGQKSYDKQFVRDYLSSLQWNKQPPAPELPDDVVAKTRSKYLQALEALTGTTYGI